MNHNGSLHVLKLGPDPVSGLTRYAMSYAAYDKGGGALPTHVAHGESDLEAVLKDLNVDGANAHATAVEARDNGRASLPNVVLSDDELRRHGLKEMGILDSVISYLSS